MGTAYYPHPYDYDTAAIALSALGAFLLLFCLAVVASLGAVALLRRYFDR